MRGSKKEIAIVIGTRPEIIKMAPVIAAFQKQKMPFFIVHTNQHYSKELDAIFFKELGLPSARHNLRIGSGTHGDQTGRMTAAIERVFLEERPRVVLVHGDTNTTLAGALAAVKLHIPIVHVEAGLRSGDRKMPEEINRIIVDHVSDVLCVPSAQAAQNLRDENIPASRIVVTGNTIADAVAHFAPLALQRTILAKLGITSKNFILATLHRPESVDTKETLKTILGAFGSIAEKYGMPIVMPMHPRTHAALARHRIRPPKGVRACSPVGYLDFLALEQHARIILTDSGGLQEEAYLLRIPAVTVSGTTERPETLSGGGNIIAGRTHAGLVRAAARQIARTPRWHTTFGKPGSAQKVARSTQRF